MIIPTCVIDSHYQFVDPSSLSDDLKKGTGGAKTKVKQEKKKKDITYRNSQDSSKMKLLSKACYLIVDTTSRRSS